MVGEIVDFLDGFETWIAVSNINIELFGGFLKTYAQTMSESSVGSV